MPQHEVRERTRIQVCGRLSVEIDGVEVAPRLRGRQVPLLFAFLALNRERGCGRDELIGAVWPERAPRSQDAALRTLLSRVRSALGPDALAGRDELALALPEPVWVDFEAAATQLARGLDALRDDDPQVAWSRAQVPLEIAGRGLLPGVEAPWLIPRRRDLELIRLQALELLGRAGLRLGDPRLGAVERAARTLIESEPYRESGYVLLMGALRAQGNVAEALRVFDRLRRLLRDELGTTPSPETIAAHAQLLSPGPVSGDRRRRASDREPGRIELSPELRALGRAALVGRREELAELQAWWSAAHDERALLLRGDGGIGKSRLLAVAAARCHAEGAIVLAGRASEDALVGFEPFLEALGQYALGTEPERLRAVTDHAAPELAVLVDELRRRLPDLPAPRAGDPQTDRYRLFEAVATMLGRIAAELPLLLVLDDLHWADRTTLMLLRHVVRSPRTGRARILGAYRTGEPLPEALTSGVAGLRREGLTRLLDLRGIAEADARELIRARTGVQPSGPFVRALCDESEGNPLFIEQLLANLAQAGIDAAHAGPRELREAGVPEDVRGLISRRTARLSPDCVQWLRTAAVIGRDFELDLLASILEFDEERFVAALEEALDTGLVRESIARPGRLSFGHALIRQTLYADLSTPRRTRLHHRIGVALERAGERAAVDELALHFARGAGAEDAERAIRYAREAAERATAILANEEATVHYARALEVQRRVHPDARAQLMELLLELGEAQVRSGDRPGALTVLEEAAQLAVALDDTAALTRAAVGASWRYIQPPGVVDERLIELLERALAATAGEPTVTRVRLLFRLGGALYFTPRRGEMEGLAAEATALAATLRDPRADALAAAARRRARWGPDRLAERLRDSSALMAAARRTGDPELMQYGHSWLLIDLLERGDRAGVDAQLRAFSTGAARLRQPLFLWQAEIWRAMLALLEGRLDDADRFASEALALGLAPDRVTTMHYRAVQLLAIRREQLRTEELEPTLREMLAADPDRPVWRAALAMLLADGDRVDAARAELRAIAPRLATLVRDIDWMPTMALLAEAAADAGDAEHAALLLGQLAPFAEATVVVGAGVLCRGAVAGHLGALAVAAGRRDHALAPLRRAGELNAALGASLPLAYSRLERAVALGPGPEAAALVAEVAALAAQRELPRLSRQIARVRALLDGERALPGGA